MSHREIDGQRVAMAGIPEFAVERYSDELYKNGFVVNITNRPPDNERYAGVSKALAHELFDVGHRVYEYNNGSMEVIHSSEDIDNHLGFLMIDNPVLLDRAQTLISDFYEHEYGDDSADFSNLHKVSLAYTTTEDGASEIQVDADLVDYRIIKYLDNHEVEREQFKDLYDMVENGLSDLNFDELVFMYESDIAAVMPEQSKEYDIGFGSLGNGTTVWNRLEEVNGDYKTIAHIEDNGDVKYYEELPDDVKQRIERQAEFEKAIYQSINSDTPQRTRRNTEQINYDILSR